MNKNRRYPISKELLERIIPIVRRLDGLSELMKTLGESIGFDKYNLWDTIYTEYPELQGKLLKIDELNREIVVAPQPETSRIETLPGG